MEFYNKNIGKYVYNQYSIIQGGDGGMEYAMCTLITGGSDYKSLVGTMRHEMAHSWFQFALATNETEHPWMDEGFTTFISTLAGNRLSGLKNRNPFKSGYRAYYYIVKSGKQEPLSTQGDRFKTNVAYSVASYASGELFLSQLSYIIGWNNLMKTLQVYFKDWKMRHPTPNDFIREAEKVSGLELGWYLDEWIETTHHIDYAVQSVKSKQITLKRIGAMPMPVDVTVTFIDGSTQNYNIPLRMQYGHKPTKAIILKNWAWAMPLYHFSVKKDVKSVVIDPFELTADINRSNNVLTK